MELTIDLIEWAESLPEGTSVGIDEGGLLLVALDEDGCPTGNFLEIGGIPESADMAFRRL